MNFVIEYKRSVEKELRKLTHADRVAIIEKVERLKDNPRPEGSAKLKGSRVLFRIRHGDYRVIYQIRNDVLLVIIIRVGHRRDIYRSL